MRSWIVVGLLFLGSAASAQDVVPDRAERVAKYRTCVSDNAVRLGKANKEPGSEIVRIAQTKCVLEGMLAASPDINGSGPHSVLYISASDNALGKLLEARTGRR